MSENPSGLTKKPKAQKHYRTLHEIELDMAKARDQMERWQKLAGERECEARHLYRTGDAYNLETADFKMREAKYMRDKAKRIEEVRLVKLKRAHAEFQTRLLPGMEDDASVVLGNL